MLEIPKTILLVIDYQPKLLPKIFNAQAIVPQALKLLRFAKELGLPVIVTEQYPQGLGSTVAEIAAETGDATPIAKTAFGCFGEPAFIEELAASGRSQLLITGIETHVCVMQTALVALDRGHEVYVARDAVGSRSETDYEAGLDRMARAGAQLVTTEMALFELLRDASSPEFKRVLPLLK